MRRSSFTACGVQPALKRRSDRQAGAAARRARAQLLRDGL